MRPNNMFKEPVPLKIVFDGTGRVPVCPTCGEVTFSEKCCEFCNQPFAETEESKAYFTPNTIKDICFNCGAEVVMHVSSYNGHKKYHCNKCGISMIE